MNRVFKYRVALSDMSVGINHLPRLEVVLDVVPSFFEYSPNEIRDVEVSIVSGTVWFANAPIELSDDNPGARVSAAQFLKDHCREQIIQCVRDAIEDQRLLPNKYSMAGVA